jgi:hypothetical protein
MISDINGGRENMGFKRTCQNRKSRENHEIRKIRESQFLFVWFVWFVVKLGPLTWEEAEN